MELRAKKNEAIVSYAITKDSKMIVYSTDNHIRVFNFDIVEGDARLSKSDAELGTRAQRMLFSNNNRAFATVNNEEGGCMVAVYKVEGKKRFLLVRQFNCGKQKVKNVGLMCFSPDNRYDFTRLS